MTDHARERAGTAPDRPLGCGPSVLLVGCGNMGRALLIGWREQGLPAERIAVVEPDADRAAVAAAAGVAVHAEWPPARGSVEAASDRPLAPSPDVVLLALKPQIMDRVVPAYAALAAPGRLFVSIAAGKTLAFLRAALGGEAAVIRAMPNTPAQIRRGATVACANDLATPAQRDFAERLLAAVGSVAWVEDEALLDPVTAVSGSGPAYVFLLAECLAEAGVAAGLPASLARTLARETVAGAGALLAASADDPTTLRRQVTSPGGTTAAALEILQGEGGLQSLMTAAVRAASTRASFLGRAGDAHASAGERAG
jgi:pyrroline-5-carboxylate reductase